MTIIRAFLDQPEVLVLIIMVLCVLVLLILDEGYWRKRREARWAQALQYAAELRRREEVTRNARDNA